MKRILITGGFGYIGGRVARRLATMPDTCVILGSRFKRDRPSWLPEAATVQMDWCSERSLRKACEGVAAVVHLAAANELDADRDPVGALEITTVATARLVEAAIAEKVSRLLYFSTAHVYGSPLQGHLDEKVCPRPVHPYAYSHRAAEDVVLAAHDRGKLTGVVFRVSNSFGAPTHAGVNRWTLLVNDLCRQAVTSRELKLRSAGLQRRDFVTLTDVAEATAHILSVAPEKIGDGLFNVGGGWAPTVFEMATLVAERCATVLGFRPQISIGERLPGEVTRPLNYCIDKLRDTGFRSPGDRRNDEIDAMLALCREAFSP